MSLGKKHQSHLPTSFYSEKALLLACQHGQLYFVEELLYDGADIECKDANGMTPLIVAAFSDQTPVLKRLLNHQPKVNVDAKDNDGQTALMYASFNGNQECRVALLESNASVNAVDKNGNTAFHIAAENENIECVEELLKLRYHVLNVRNQEKKTVLDVTKNEKMIELISKAMEEKPTEADGNDSARIQEEARKGTI